MSQQKKELIEKALIAFEQKNTKIKIHSSLNKKIYLYFCTKTRDLYLVNDKGEKQNFHLFIHSQTNKQHFKNQLERIIGNPDSTILFFNNFIISLENLKIFDIEISMMLSDKMLSFLIINQYGIDKINVFKNNMFIYSKRKQAPSLNFNLSETYKKSFNFNAENHLLGTFVMQCLIINTYVKMLKKFDDLVNL